MTNNSKNRGLTDRQEKAIEILSTEDLLNPLLEELNANRELAQLRRSTREKDSELIPIPKELADLSDLLPEYSVEELEIIADEF